MTQNFAWIAFGVAWLLIALFVCAALIRLRRTLAILEITLLRVEESLTEVVPEVRGTLGNVNQITAGVNVGLQAAGSGANRLGGDLGEAAVRSRRGASATLYGVGVAARSLFAKARGEWPDGDGTVDERTVEMGGAADGR